MSWRRLPTLLQACQKRRIGRALSPDDTYLTDELEGNGTVMAPWILILDSILSVNSKLYKGVKIRHTTKCFFSSRCANAYVDATNTSPIMMAPKTNLHNLGIKRTRLTLLMTQLWRSVTFSNIADRSGHHWLEQWEGLWPSINATGRSSWLGEHSRTEAKVLTPKFPRSEVSDHYSEVRQIVPPQIRLVPPLRASA